MKQVRLTVATNWGVKFHDHSDAPQPGVFNHSSYSLMCVDMVVVVSPLRVCVCVCGESEVGVSSQFKHHC